MNANERDKQQGQAGAEGQQGQQKQGMASQGQRGQQQGGQQQGGQQQAQGGEGGEYGEGNYKATRDYNEGLKEHMQSHDIEKEARDAAPKSADEERELEDAERKGKSRARGRDDDRGDPNGGEPSVN
jgi:hypothetical protein